MRIPTEQNLPQAEPLLSDVCRNLVLMAQGGIYAKLFDTQSMYYR